MRDHRRPHPAGVRLMASRRTLIALPIAAAGTPQPAQSGDTTTDASQIVVRLQAEVDVLAAKMEEVTRELHALNQRGQPRCA